MLPILYSFRRCPFAIRARLALCYTETKVELREVVLRDKPNEMLEASPKGTVPVMVLPDGQVLEESKDIMLWALNRTDLDGWLGENKCWLSETEAMIEENDFSFKPCLDKYKYADRYPEHAVEYYREQAEVFLSKLDKKLTKYAYLLGDRISLADISVFPFIRQFAFVDKAWFDQSPYPKLQQWLEALLDSQLFNSVMNKYPAWQKGDVSILFPIR